MKKLILHFNFCIFAFSLLTSIPAGTSMCQTSGNTKFIVVGKFDQINSSEIITRIEVPCPVGVPSNPIPSNNSCDIPVANNILTWENGSGTKQIELWFGPMGMVSQVYSGPPITSFIVNLSYRATHGWYVICKNDTCATQGPLWLFTTEQIPNGYSFYDAFGSFCNWTVVGPVGTSNWNLSNTNNSGGYWPELKLSWVPTFNGESKLRSDSFLLQNFACYILSFDFFFAWYANPSGTVSIGITFDGGSTSTILYSLENPTGDIGPITIYTPFFAQPLSGSQNCQIEITYTGNSNNIRNIYWDNVNLEGLLFMCPLAAPSNLTAQIIFNPDPQVQLNWQDNSFNEYGFNIYRNDALLESTEYNITEFTDSSVLPESTYTYKVFAFNNIGEELMGSNTATIEIPIPVELISFTSEIVGSDIILYWQTATETNNLGFEIERLKVSGKEKLQNWESIGFVEGKGTTTEFQSYSFIDNPEQGKYNYRLKQIDFDGLFEYSNEIEVEVKAPNIFSLEQNYPNPFNPTTKISYSISEISNVTIKVFDIVGNEIDILVNEEKAAGSYDTEFDGSSLTSGIYFYQLRAGRFIETKKMILLK